MSITTSEPIRKLIVFVDGIAFVMTSATAVIVTMRTQTKRTILRVRGLFLIVCVESHHRIAVRIVVMFFG